MKAAFYYRLIADNDPSGNPQRLWVQLRHVPPYGAEHEGFVIERVYDEGYRGLPEALLWRNGGSEIHG